MVKYQQISFADIQNRPGRFVRVEIEEDGSSTFGAKVQNNRVQIPGAQVFGMATPSDAFDAVVQNLLLANGIQLGPDIYLLVSEGMLEVNDVINVLNTNGVTFNHPIHVV